MKRSDITYKSEVNPCHHRCQGLTCAYNLRRLSDSVTYAFIKNYNRQKSFGQVKSAIFVRGFTFAHPQGLTPNTLLCRQIL